MSIQPSWLEQAHRNARWIVVLGIVQIVAGALALGAPAIGGVVATMFMGASLLVAGVAGLVAAFQAGSFGIGVLAFIWALMLAGTGASFLANPGAGLVTLTLVAAVMFLISGIGQVFQAMRMRPVQGWGWLMTGGILGVMMAVMVWREFPFSGLWFIGTLVGVHLLFAGMGTVSVGKVARVATATTPTGA